MTLGFSPLFGPNPVAAKLSAVANRPPSDRSAVEDAAGSPDLRDIRIQSVLLTALGRSLCSLPGPGVIAKIILDQYVIPRYFFCLLILALPS